MENLSGDIENDAEQELQSASSEELVHLISEEESALDYGKIQTAEQILADTNVLDSFNVDEEAMQFYLDYSVNELWKSAFRDKDNTITAVRREGKNGNKYHDTVVDTFLSDYESTTKNQNTRWLCIPIFSYSDAVVCSIQSKDKSILWEFLWNWSRENTLSCISK